MASNLLLLTALNVDVEIDVDVEIADSYSKADLERLKNTLEMKQVSYERPRSQSRDVALFLHTKVVN